MCFEIIDQQDRIAVILSGTFGVKEAASIRQQLFPLIHNGAVDVVFHLGAVTDIDSAAMGLLLAVKRIALDRQTNAAFLDVPAALRERLQLSGILQGSA
ncbi:STAS domain-containing protein [Cohnella sp. LGH]|uniref:STAS domain-containing protein n=1 Tax=unclassified Cohnella TaxID=2636738 RepID=UPI001AD9BAA4|nr:STAS domain-containing protein [Cohnella sp. LGH]QTH43363.1 STAS domain-containing protein [Cohnella sp. LGH]